MKTTAANGDLVNRLADATTDYNVVFRERPVGRIWRCIHEKTDCADYPWHWSLRPSNDPMTQEIGGMP